MCQSSVVRPMTALMLIATLSLANGDKSVDMNYETVHNSNAAILNRLGLVPLRIPDGHHKKRLAGPEPSDGLVTSDSRTRIHQPYSRRHGHRDSHVYIVKLPASQPYYTLTKPHSEATGHQRLDNIASSDTDPHVGFHSNGKPAKIYHWNLPMVKKMTEKKRLHSKFRLEQMRKKYEMELNDRERQSVQSLIGHENAFFHDNEKLTAAVPAIKPIVANSNVKRYHHSTSVNGLHDDEKPVKHVRNNDKRLNYPKISEQLRESSGTNASMKLNGIGNAIGNKMSRLEDSNLYRLGSGGLRSKDRPIGWKFTDELRSSWNKPHGQKSKKHRKKSATTYYAPIDSAKKFDVEATGTKKYFPGNGKPKAFYVMEKSRQPVYYHPLLP